MFMSSITFQKPAAIFKFPDGTTRELSIKQLPSDFIPDISAYGTAGVAARPPVDADYGTALRGIAFNQIPAVSNPSLHSSSSASALLVSDTESTVRVLWSHVGYGILGLGGALGYGSGRVSFPPQYDGWSFISAHAPSAVLVQVSCPIRLAGFFDNQSRPKSPVLFYASGNFVGQVDHPGDTTDREYGEFILDAGEHLLESVLLHASSDNAHTVWCYRPADQN